MKLIPIILTFVLVFAAVIFIYFGLSKTFVGVFLNAGLLFILLLNLQFKIKKQEKQNKQFWQ